MLVIDANGEKLGVLERDVAIQKAKQQDLDLVEIAGQANPPVAKIIDFQKFKYEENKKEQVAKRHAKDVELKEIWLSPRIAEHDLQTRLRRAEEFLGDGNKVQFRIKFKGREMGNLQLGFQLMQKIFTQFGDRILVERDPKVEGRSITTIIGRSKGSASKVAVPSNNDQVSNNVQIQNTNDQTV